ncbi:MAG TPA: type II toxin-antitoxin system HicB family antitoxin [Isosphaeraceae bacterium]
MEIPIKVAVHKSRAAGGYWAEVPALPGCVSEGETLEELRTNIRESIECWMDVGQGASVTPDEDDDGPVQIITL